MTQQIFLSVDAQHQNLGDVLLRREMVRLLQPFGKLHILAKQSPPQYIQALEVPGDSVVYRSAMRWLLALGRVTVLHRVLLIYSPGPQRLSDSPRHIGAELMRILLTTALKVAGSSAVKLGRSFEGRDPVMSSLVRIHNQVLSLCTCRDSRSAIVLRNRCAVFPDLVLATGDVRPAFSGEYIAISLRYDGSIDVELLAATLTRLAASLGLRPLVVNQVAYDAPIGQRLADLLGANLIGNEQSTEGRIRETANAYRMASVVVSDRLHALVTGMTYGAIPVPLASGPMEKVSSALAEIGLHAPARSLEDLARIGPDDLSALRLRTAQALTLARVRLADLPGLLEGCCTAQRNRPA